MRLVSSYTDQELGRILPNNTGLNTVLNARVGVAKCQIKDSVDPENGEVMSDLIGWGEQGRQRKRNETPHDIRHLIAALVERRVMVFHGDGLDLRLLLSSIRCRLVFAAT